MLRKENLYSWDGEIDADFWDVIFKTAVRAEELELLRYFDCETEDDWNIIASVTKDFKKKIQARFFSLPEKVYVEIDDTWYDPNNETSYFPRTKTIIKNKKEIEEAARKNEQNRAIYAKEFLSRKCDEYINQELDRKYYNLFPDEPKHEDDLPF